MFNEYRLEHKRTIYNLLEVLGDVGGLGDSLTKIGAFVIALYQFFSGHQMSQYLVSSIFERDNSHELAGNNFKEKISLL